MKTHLLAALALTAAVTQQAPQAPTFRGRIDVARLDVEVVDRKTGRPITNLTERDFIVTENGERQEISTFAIESLTAEFAPPGAPRSVVRTASADIVAPRTRRVFLFVVNVNRWGTDGPVKPLDGMIRFIREQLLPQDLVAVMAFNRATDLTTDHEQVAQVIERLRLQKEAVLYKMYLQSVVAKRDDEDLLPDVQADIDQLFQPGDASVPSPRSTTTMLLGTDVFRAADDVSWRRPWNRMVAASDMLKMYAGIEYLRQIDGEKHLICLTPGMQLPLEIPSMPRGLFVQDTDDEDHLAMRANDAHVVLDIINTSGVPPAPPGDGGSNLAGLDAIMSSQNIAGLTGGQYTGVRTADAALTRIDATTRAGYVLGYTPTNQGLDGKRRKVDVKVNRKDVTVLFKRAYTARPDVAPIDLRDIVTNARLRAAAATDVEVRDIKIDARASFASWAGTAGSVRVDVKIAAAKLTLTENFGRREGTIDLLILCGDRDQKSVGMLKQRMYISLDEEHYREVMSSGLPYTVSLPVSAPATIVKVLAYDFGADLLGSAVIRLR